MLALLIACLLNQPAGALPHAPTATQEPRPAPADEVSKERLMAHLKSLPAKRGVNGGPEHQEGVRQTEALIHDHLKLLGLTPTLHEFRMMQPFRKREGDQPQKGEPPAWHNIIVEFTGAEKPTEIILVGAHFDAVPAAPGADDNGTGAAALMELARVLKDRPMKRTVRLVYFNAEEAGLVGSRQYIVDHMPVSKRSEFKLIGMISLEMLGYFSDKEGSQKSPIPAVEGVFTPPTVGDFIGIATTRLAADFAKQLDEAMRASAPGLKTVRVDFVPDPPLTPPDILRSDHGAFLLSGLPGVMVTDTANFRNPNYHKPTDTVDTIDADRFTLVVRGLAGAIERLANPR